MFETAELGRATSKKDYKEQEPFLRVGLLTVQYELRDSDFAVILVLGGIDQPGCTEVLNVLHEWMDPRYLEANVYEDLTQEEAERPRFWRYWRTLQRTSTDRARWNIVAGNDKRWARIDVLKTVCRAMASGLK